MALSHSKIQDVLGSEAALPKKQVHGGGFETDAIIKHN